MPTKNPFNFLDVHTNKGAAHMLAGMAVGQGQPAQAHLLTTGVFVDREVVTIGDGAAAPPDDDIYEIVDISTDSTINSDAIFTNTDPAVILETVDPADYTFVVGDYVGTELELGIVTHILVNSATDWDISITRGVAGTTIVSHGDVAVLVREGTALTADTITVPMIGVTAAIGLAALASIVGNQAGRGPVENGAHGVPEGVLPPFKQSNWRFVNMNDVIGFLFSTIGGVRATDVAITAGNNDWETAVTYRGTNAQANISQSHSIVPTAEEVAGEIIVVPCNFEPTGVDIYVSTTADGLIELFDGVVTLDRVSNLVLIEFGGLVDLAETSTVSVTVHGNVDVADAAVIG